MTENGISISRRSVLKKSAITTGALVFGGTAASGTAAAGIGDGRVLDYHLNNLKGKGREKTKVHDASPAKNDGAWEGDEQDPIVKDGAVGNAFAFDGEEDYIVVDHDGSLSSTTLTVATWLKFTEDAAYHFFLSKRGDDGGEYQMYYRGAEAGKAEKLAYWDGDDIYEGDLSLNEGVWHHLAWVVSQEGEFRGYHDGNEVVTDDASTPADGKSSLYIGTDNVGNFAKSMVDEVRVYDRALSDAEITKLYEMKD